MTTPSDILTGEDAERKQLLSPSGRDGLIIAVLKYLLGRNIWRWPYRTWVELFLKATGQFKKDYASENQARIPVWQASDTYMLAWSALLVVGYLTAFWAREWPVVLIVVSGLSAYRVIEILSILVELHTQVGYLTSAPIRAVANTLWHYGEIAVAFGVLHLANLEVCDEEYNGGFPAVIDAIYFSFVTIATVGYGDISPKGTCGKLLVVSEVVVGMVLLVFVIQRAIAAGLCVDQRATDGPKSDTHS